MERIGIGPPISLLTSDSVVEGSKFHIIKDFSIEKNERNNTKHVTKHILKTSTKINLRIVNEKNYISSRLTINNVSAKGNKYFRYLKLAGNNISNIIIQISISTSYIWDAIFKVYF